MTSRRFARPGFLTRAGDPCRVPRFPGNAPDPVDARLSHPHLRRPPPRRRGGDGPARRLGASQARSRPAAVCRSARPLRHHAMRDRHIVAAVRGSRRAAPRKRRVVHRQGRQAVAGNGQPESRDRRDRAGHRRVRIAVGRRAAAVPGQQRRRVPGGDASRLPLSRPAARAGARQHHAALACHRVDPPPHDRAGFRRVPDA